MKNHIILFDEKIHLSHVFIRGTRLKEFLKNNVDMQSVLEKRFSFNEKKEFMKRIIKHVVIFTFRLLNEYYLYSEKSFERELSLDDLFLHIPENLGVHSIPRKLLYIQYFFLVVRLLQVEMRYLYEEEDFIFHCNELLLSTKDNQKGVYISVIKHKVEFDCIQKINNILLIQYNKLKLPLIIKQNTKLVSQKRTTLSKGIFSKLRFI